MRWHGNEAAIAHAQYDRITTKLALPTSKRRSNIILCLERTRQIYYYVAFYGGNGRRGDILWRRIGKIRYISGVIKCWNMIYKLCPSYQINFVILLPVFQGMVTDILGMTNTRKKTKSNYQQDHASCLKMFEKWSESEQVKFVEMLLSRMCHYQHGHINSFLKPMLQRDFITSLPGMNNFVAGIV